MNYQVLARKWRPRYLAALVGQDHVVKALNHALYVKKLHHAYLFTGTRGVGKTTLARILAKAMNCEIGITPTPCGKCHICTQIDSGFCMDYIEMDAASNRGIDEVVSLLDRSIYAPINARFKIYMIDEIHMLTQHAFNAMLKTLEEPPSHLKFILATTDPQKIPATILSRCLQFNLKRLISNDIFGYLKLVLDAESIPYEASALRILARAADGSMRDGLSLTDQAIAYSAGNVNESTVRDMLGTLDQRYLIRLLDCLAANDGAGLIEIANEIASRNLSFSIALQDIARCLHRIAWAQFSMASLLPDAVDFLEIERFASSWSSEQVQLLYQIATIGRNELPLAPDEYSGFTMTLLRMLAFTPEIEVNSLKLDSIIPKPNEHGNLVESNTSQKISLSNHHLDSHLLSKKEECDTDNGMLKKNEKSPLSYANVNTETFCKTVMKTNQVVHSGSPNCIGYTSMQSKKMSRLPNDIKIEDCTKSILDLGMPENAMNSVSDLSEKVLKDEQFLGRKMLKTFQGLNEPDIYQSNNHTISLENDDDARKVEELSDIRYKLNQKPMFHVHHSQRKPGNLYCEIPDVHNESTFNLSGRKKDNKNPFFFKDYPDLINNSKVGQQTKTLLNMLYNNTVTSLESLFLAADWVTIASSLGLQGKTKEIAMQSKLISYKEDCIVLAVPLETLELQEHAIKIEKALVRRIGHPCRVKIKIKDRDLHYLTACSDTRYASTHSEAKKLIKEDPIVRSLLHDFAGKIVPGSESLID